MEPTAPPESPQPSEAEVEAQVRARQTARKAREGTEADGSDKTPQQVMRAAAKGEDLSSEEVHDALEVFLAAEGEEPEIEPKGIKLNIGSTKHPKYIRWVIVPVDDDEIVAIRRRSQKGNRRLRRGGDAEVDENLVARRIVLRGTVEPDIGELAKTLKLADPSDALLKYFRKFGKTGLILQISGEILNISGYDEDDVSELDAALG